MSERRTWTSEEDDYLARNAHTSSLRDLGDALGRSRRSVEHRVQRLSLQRQTLRRWTPEEDALIRIHLLAGLGAVAQRLDRNPTVVSERAKRLGLTFRVPARERDYGGYRAVRKQYVHRTVVEKSLGRPLQAGERVHHVNLNKRDNAPHNLYLCSDRSHHQRVHRSIDRLIPELLEQGLIRFDRAGGRYELCEIRK